MTKSCGYSISRVMVEVMKHVIPGEKIIHLGIGDPSSISCFRTAITAEDAVIRALRSGNFDGYSPTAGLPQARRYF